MDPKTDGARKAYYEAVEAIENAIVLQRGREAAKEPFDGRMARERGPVLQSMKTFLEECNPEAMGNEILRVAQSLRRFEEETYTSFLSLPKWMRQKAYLRGVAAMVIVNGASLGRGLPDADA